MDDSRINRAQNFLAEALRTGDSTYMRALIIEAQQMLIEVLDD